MSNLEDEIGDLREKNNELVQEVQHWKVTAAQKEKEKLELMREINELRLKLSRVRSGGIDQLRKLDSALQSTTEEALSHLVQASGSIARTLEFVKQYISNRQELDEASPRWSAISGTPVDKVNKVPPLLIGGQSIQPVVSLSRTLVNSTNRRARISNERNNVTERAVPMHMLQDVYIPLTRIDLDELQNNRESTNNNSVEDLAVDEHEEELLNESQNISESFETSRRLDAVIEETEDLVASRSPAPNRMAIDNPLEGPSWLLDASNNISDLRDEGRLDSPQPDSTTRCEASRSTPSPAVYNDGGSTEDEEKENEPVCVFSPTVRKRKRTVSPPPPQKPLRRSTNNRVLKVVLSKMRLSDEDPGGSGDASPPKRPPKRSTILPGPRKSDPKTERPETPKTKRERFDAPSPNGATDARVIVLETKCAGSSRESSSHGVKGQSEGRNSRDFEGQGQDNTLQEHRNSSLQSQGQDVQSHSRQSHESDSDHSSGQTEGRSRRARKNVAYKEKPLNRKMRR